MNQNTHNDDRTNVTRCNAGIIGAGRIGQVHLDTLASVPGVNPVIISDVVEPVLKMVTEKYGVPKYTMDVSYHLLLLLLPTLLRARGCFRSASVCCWAAWLNSVAAVVVFLVSLVYWPSSRKRPFLA